MRNYLFKILIRTQNAEKTIKTFKLEKCLKKAEVSSGSFIII